MDHYCNGFGISKSWMLAMKILKRINKTVWVVLIILLVVQVLFDPLSPLVEAAENYQAQTGLPKARYKWDLQGITHYKFDIRGHVPNACIVGGSVEVQNEKVIHLGPSTESIKKAEPFLDVGFWTMDDPPICNSKNYTFSSFFAMIENQLGSVTQISFDLDYGFISSFQLGSSGGHGLFSMRLFDCCSNFRVFNFVVLNE
jgi:hypothetical protein